MYLLDRILNHLSGADRFSRARMVALYLGGEGVRVIAERFRLHRSVVVEMLRGVERDD